MRQPRGRVLRSAFQQYGRVHGRGAWRYGESECGKRLLGAHALAIATITALHVLYGGMVGRWCASVAVAHGSVRHGLSYLARGSAGWLMAFSGRRCLSCRRYRRVRGVGQLHTCRRLREPDAIGDQAHAQQYTQQHRK